MIGLAMLMQTPNGAMFTTGLESKMFAIGLLSAITRLAGTTVNVEGAAPNVQVIIAPATTGMPMHPR